MMTPEEFQAIKNRNAARTQGEWTLVLGSKTVVRWAWDGQFDFGGIEVMDGTFVLGANRFGYDSLEAKKEDAEFLVSASVDVPAMITEIERLQTRIAVLEKANRILESLLDSPGDE